MAKKKAAGARGGAGRAGKALHPNGTPKVVTDAIAAKIAALHVRAVPQADIAKIVGIPRSTVWATIENKLRPKWQQELNAPLAEELAKVTEMERVAWECFRSSQDPETVETIETAMKEGGGDPELLRRVIKKTSRTGNTTYLDLIKWAVDWRSKIFGHYREEKAALAAAPTVVEVVVTTPEHVRREITADELSAAVNRK